MKRFFPAFVLAAACNPAWAQRVTVQGTLSGAAPERLELFLVPVTESPVQEADTLHVRDGEIQGESDVSPWGIYRIVAIHDRSQTALPVAFPAEDGKAVLRLDFSGERGLRVLEGGADTDALAAFNSYYAETSKELWTGGKDMEASALKRLVTSYLPVADSIIARCGASDTVARYMRIWASAVTYETIESLRFSVGRDASALGLGDASQMEELCASVDCDLSAAFRQQVTRMVLASLPDGSPEERMDAIKARFRNEKVREAAIDLMLTRYVNEFPYATRYEEGLSELTALTAKHGLDPRYLEAFRAREVSIPGSPFPAQATLYDLEGNAVDFARYRGKYVYIDLWASWCAPCIREIPDLKQLEANLENKDVAFLSVSLDKDEAAWKRKVDELSLKGDLLIDRGGKLAEALGVRGIPFFLIYDREGRLFKYGAPRPSNPATKPLLEALE